MNSTKTSLKEITTDTIKDFFDNLLVQIKEDKHAMLLGIAAEEKAAMYEKFISGDKDAVAEMLFQQNSFKIITQMFSQYVNELIKKPLPKKITINFDTSTINVLAIISDNDKEASANLILAESSIIPTFFSKGFRMNTMIFEESDNVDIPEGYYEFVFPKK